jgi:gluconolactonase
MLEVYDPAVRRLVAPDVAGERIAAGFTWVEGPVWIGDSLLCSDTIRNRIARWREGPAGPELTTYRYPSGGPPDPGPSVKEPGSNGLTLDRQRRLIVCEHGARRVTRTEPDGTLVTLADRWQGRRLNSPNDAVVRSDGAVYFSDPFYGLLPYRERQELPFQGVFRVDPAGGLHLVADDFEGPNGLVFSPDERTLYVADSERHHLRVFAMADDGNARGGRLLLEADTPDGLTVDRAGNLWVATADGVRIYTADGAPLGRVALRERPSNLAWGGADGTTLYVTATTGLYRLPTLVGGRPPG